MADFRLAFEDVGQLGALGELGEGAQETADSVVPVRPGHRRPE
jgi:hypothetical protein